MSLITATGLGKSFGPVDIFSGISLSIPHRSRIAIVGPNGIGKTTLLRILAGEDTPSAGQVSQARGLRIGYLPQEAGLETTHTLVGGVPAAVCRAARSGSRAGAAGSCDEQPRAMPSRL